MATPKPEAPKPDADRAEKKADAAAGAAPAAGGKSAMQAWLPMIVAVVLLPVVAYLITTFVLLPKLQAGLGVAPAAASPAAGGHAKPKEAKEGKEPKEAKESSHGGGGHGGGGEGEGADENGREQAPLTKLIVNVAGTQASRILLSSLILVGDTPDFSSAVKTRDAQLRDTACGILGTKTIQDLEKPGARNIIRSELITAFNHVLGGSPVQEIYFTEFAVQ